MAPNERARKSQGKLFPGHVSTLAVPYVGMTKVFDFIHATNDALTERGVALPLPDQSTTTPENRAEKGLAVQKQITGSDAVENLRAWRPATHPALAGG
jgi:hypothetical protein